MPPVDDVTSNKGYQKPNAANTLAYDVARLRAALDAIDADMASAGATGGGTDQVFQLNSGVCSVSYTLPSGKNAISAGPIVINSGVTITIPSNQSWVIV